MLEVLQGGGDMERTSSSECVAAVRGDNDRHSTHDGVRVDGTRYCHQVCEGTSRCGSAVACQFLLNAITPQLSDNCLTSIVDGRRERGGLSA